MTGALVKGARRLLSLARKEQAVHRRLHRDALATLHALEVRSPEFARARARAHACIVFPSLGQGSAVLGGTWGMGEVFVRRALVGYAALARLTAGVQLGGQTSWEVILLEDAASLERLRARRTGLTLDAAVTVVKAGVAWARQPGEGASVYLSTRGGLWAGAGLGVQRLFFAPAVLTRAPALRRVLPSLAFRRERVSAEKSDGTREGAMAMAQSSKVGRKVLGVASELGHRGPGEVPGKVAERAREVARRVGTRGKRTVEQLREHVPDTRALKERAGQARAWTREQLGEHAVAIGLTTLAAGVAGAALLPVSERERRALASASAKVKSVGHSIGANPRLGRVVSSVKGVVRRRRNAGQGETSEPVATGRKTVERAAAARTARPAAKRAKKKTASAPSGRKAAGQPTAARTARPKAKSAKRKPATKKPGGTS
ncbi:hypothetical protein SAMN05443572_11085 [Myxococcus fulvus]|uniref:Uncharacterized protein n=1 Tax=Myxococcus fulvus TaxID=33 RepID=A0A511T9Q3_MYXFU|nr:hypothetical protein [Myxococcus fulvus]GEN10313.1 hypothetical protein MFU01_53500 [Myxococcus fulvus]SEU34588.1 hypothetical protein SAMN05443572_11085 [Myxococcus fulvus]